ncbi:MAG: class I SAM-dependent methyltransferase, partial [Proteobacteria bacterium]|nr:class I SAM-dependent methyltransferase [Pseudomonadota bacterium]
LYRHCGIPPVLVKGATVLEIGPGTGHNALYTNSLQPEKYTMVDGARKSVQSLKKLFNSHFSDISNCEIIESDIHHFKTDHLFDMVICEGTIPFQKEPQTFLKHISKFVAPSGLLIITCVDSVSYLSEILRRIISCLIFHEQNCHEIRDRLSAIKPVFSSHLKTLKGMSRPVEDWIYDNILQPFIGAYLSVEDAVTSLEDTFDVYGSSPHFLLDWRWYKDIHGQDMSFNGMAKELYLKNVHNLLDYRFLFDPVEAEAGLRMIQLCNQIYTVSIELQNHGVKKQPLERLVDILQRLSLMTDTFSIQTSEAIIEVSSGVVEFIKKNKFPENNLNRFSSWFGRGQQYLSFIKRV